MLTFIQKYIKVFAFQLQKFKISRKKNIYITISYFFYKHMIYMYRNCI